MRLSIAALFGVLALGSMLARPAYAAGGVLAAAQKDFGQPSSTQGIRVLNGLPANVCVIPQRSKGKCSGGIDLVSASASLNLGGAVVLKKQMKMTFKRDAKADCGVSVSGSLVSISGECKLVVGTFKAGATGPNAAFSCGKCGCEAGIALATVEVEYDTPEVGACGFKGKVSVGAGASLGLKLGATRKKTAGAKVSVGPFMVSGGIEITSFDAGKAGGCVKDAFAWVGGKAAGFFKGVGSKIWGGAKDVVGNLVGRVPGI